MGRDQRLLKGDCGTAFSSGNSRKVTKPKLFDEAMHVRLPAGTKARIDALRGKTRQGDFVRNVLLESLERLERTEEKD